MEILDEARRKYLFALGRCRDGRRKENPETPHSSVKIRDKTESRLCHLPVLGVEDDVDGILSARVRQLSHLPSTPLRASRRLTRSAAEDPALPRWAKLCRAYGAGATGSAIRSVQPLMLPSNLKLEKPQTLATYDLLPINLHRDYRLQLAPHTAMVIARRCQVADASIARERPHPAAGLPACGRASTRKSAISNRHSIRVEIAVTP